MPNCIAQPHLFVINGQMYMKTRYTVERVLKDVKPKTLRKYYVVVNHRRYPPKQVISALTGLGLSEFALGQCITPLRRLGFKLRYLGRP